MGMNFFIYPRIKQIGRSLEDEFIISLNPHLKYMVGIADRDFFLLNPLPTFNPRVLLSIPEKNGRVIVTLKVTRHEKMRYLEIFHYIILLVINSVILHP